MSASDATSTPSPLPRTFWFLAGSGTIGALGAGAMSGVLPLLASAVTSDPLMITVVAAASYLPWLALSLYIGVLVDRWDRVRLLRAALLTSAAATLALAGLVASGLAELWVLVAAALVLGTAEVLIGNSFQSLLPELLAKDQLRQVEGEPGSFAVERPGRPTGGAGRSPVWQQAAFFDSLIGQQDRHRGNFLMDRDRITLIDHGYTFARLGDPLNMSGLQAGRRDSPLSDSEVDALNRLLDSPDTLGLAGILEPDRLDALRSRAKLMRKNKSILPPGSY